MYVEKKMLNVILAGSLRRKPVISIFSEEYIDKLYMEVACCPETPVTNHHTLCNNPGN